MFVIEGHGYGHGVGLSQYGAEGLTRHGYSYLEVLAHYYPGTSLARVPQSARIRVLIATGYRSVSVASAGSVSIWDGAGATAELGPGAYTVGPTQITKGGNALSPRPPLRLEPTSSPLRLNGRAFRGSLVISPDRSGLSVTNDLPIDLYVRGVVAREMPANWGTEALKAQAVAARSYALASLRPSRSFDVYPDQRSQMYGGVTAEARATNAAVVGPPARCSSGKDASHPRISARPPAGGQPEAATSGRAVETCPIWPRFPTLTTPCPPSTTGDRTSCRRRLSPPDSACPRSTRPERHSTRPGE
jgi:peptidoglycan hydrolase-like amidase